MRVSTVLTWVIVAGVLAGLVAWTMVSGPRTGTVRGEQTPESWTIPIDPARVTALVRFDAGVESVRAERSGDQWLLRWGGAAEAANSWRADEGKVRAAIRLLSTTQVTLSAEDEAAETVVTVRVYESEGRSVEIGFGPRSAGGQTPVTVYVHGKDGFGEKKVVGRIGSGVPDALARTPWAVWRDPSIFGAASATTRAFEVHGAGLTTRLERSARGWAITQPFQMEADVGEVTRTLALIGSIEAASFEEQPLSPELTGLGTPLAMIRLEREVGDRTLVIGGSADAARKTVYARVSDGPINALVQLSAEQINSQFSAAPQAYARRTPVAVPAADVGMVRVVSPEGQTRFEATRQAGLWQTAGRAATPDERDAIDRLFRILASEPAASVGITEIPPEGRDDLGQVHLLTGDGTPITRVSVRRGDALQLVVSQDLTDGRSMVWTNASEQAKAVAIWLSALAMQG